MAAKIVPFRRFLSRPDAETLIRNLARDSANIDFDLGHPFKHGITTPQILLVLRDGKVCSDPKQDEYGDLRCEMKRIAAGRKIRVIVAITGRSRLTVLTAMHM